VPGGTQQYASKGSSTQPYTAVPEPPPVRAAGPGIGRPGPSRLVALHPPGGRARRYRTRLAGQPHWLVPQGRGSSRRLDRRRRKRGGQGEESRLLAKGAGKRGGGGELDRSASRQTGRQAGRRACGAQHRQRNVAALRRPSIPTHPQWWPHPVMQSLRVSGRGR
jgi:hypothetical protein